MFARYIKCGWVVISRMLSVRTAVNQRIPRVSDSGAQLMQTTTLWLMPLMFSLSRGISRFKLSIHGSGFHACVHISTRVCHSCIRIDRDASRLCRAQPKLRHSHRERTYNACILIVKKTGTWRGRKASRHAHFECVVVYIHVHIQLVVDTRSDCHHH